MSTQKNPIYTNRAGVAALFIIVVVGASALLMALGASFLGIGELTSGFTDAGGEATLSIADGCLEEALERIRYNPTILPAELAATPPPYADGSCILEAAPSGSHIVLTVTASRSQYYKKIIAIVDPTSTTGDLLVSWEEVSH